MWPAHTWRNGYRRWFPKLSRTQPSGGCRFNLHYMRVTIQEYLTLNPVMAKGIRTGEPRGFNKGRSSKFREGSRVRQTPDKDRMIFWPKRCRNNNKDEDNSPKTLNDKNFWKMLNTFKTILTRLGNMWKNDILYQSLFFK